MKRFVAIAACILIAGLAAPADLAAQTPLSAEAAIERDRLFEALLTAPSEEAADPIEFQIMQFWMSQAPDQSSAEMMTQVMERRRQYDFAGAMKILDPLVERAPNWAEAWNQRATVLYLQQNFEDSLVDVERVLELEPKHFGALAGKAIMLMQQGRTTLGQKALREALALDPWLSERRMLLPEAPSQKL
ncbi:MAG TPA: tetratricopeptide repeat protein [Thermohalobaculum sp.]|nr:tetratricopeptide repeat protein [Thermohalobaculum sp.]